MYKLPLSIAMGSLLLLSAFAEGRPRLPQPDAERGSIGLTVKAIPPIKIGKIHAVQVSFVRVLSDEDALNAEYVITSNYSKNRQIYLLNAKPGRYVAVAAQLRAAQGLVGGQQYYVFFSADLIRQTEIEVSADEIVFMGDYVVNTAMKMIDADPSQGHYYRLILPTTAPQGYMKRLFGGIIPYLASLNQVAKDPDAEKEVWSLAQKKVFRKEPDWQSRAQHKLADLSELQLDNKPGVSE